MKLKARLNNLSRTLDDKYLLTICIDTDIRAEYQKLIEQDIDVVLEKHRERRSLDANAYFHVLVGKIADALTISKSHAKNMMITRYGQIDTLDGEPIVIKTNIQPESMREQEFLHCLPIKADYEKGNTVIFYRVYKGSHLLNTFEFSKLLEGTIQEAKELGIETATPDELERMMALYEKKKIDNK